MGYSQAGFDVTGVDINPQRRYPFDFIHANAIDYVQDHWQEYDVIAASPPCQAFSKAQVIQGKEHNDLISITRKLISKKPFIIENVVGAPLKDPILLCGAMFGLRTYRHRLFESNLELVAPTHPEHIWKQNKMGRPPKDGEFMHVVGHISGLDYAKKAMGIDWMTTREIVQSIPPAYTKFIGKQVLSQI